MLAVGLLAPPAAQAGDPAQLVGLFIQGCLPFAGRPAELRAWAERTGLRAAPDQARAAFLHGAPGQVFDASTADAKLALVSSDDGLCSAVTDQATQQAVVAALQQGFEKAGLRYRLVIERDDPKISTIHDREYLAAKGQRGWRVLVSTVKSEHGGEAMLTGGTETVGTGAGGTKPGRTGTGRTGIGGTGTGGTE